MDGTAGSGGDNPPPVPPRTWQGRMTPGKYNTCHYAIIYEAYFRKYNPRIVKMYSNACEISDQEDELRFKSNIILKK